LTPYRLVGILASAWTGAGRSKAAFKTFTAGGPRPERAAVLMAAADGLWLMEFFGTSPFTARQRSAVIKGLVRLADE